MERKELRSARLDKHWTLAQAAEQLEVDLNTLSRWEHGKTRPHGYNIVKLCQVYEKTAAELGLSQEQEDMASAQALSTPLSPRSFLTVPSSDQTAPPPLQTKIADTPTAPVSSTLAESLSPNSLPPLPSQQRTSRHLRLARRGAILLAVLALIGISAGIGYSLPSLFAHGLNQKPSQKLSGGTVPTRSTAEQGSTLTPASATPTGTDSEKSPVSTSSRQSATPIISPGTSPGTPTVTATSVPDCLSGSASKLTFTSVLGLGNVSPGVLTLTNCGGPAQNWSASTTTTSGGNWLSAFPSTGLIATNEKASVQIQAAATGLQIGTYHGSITFTKGSSFWIITVSFTIIQV